jgi:death on curing protein
MEWEWVDLQDVLAIHDRQITEEFGGGRPGIKDLGIIDSAVMHPQNLAYYSENEVTLGMLAGAYAVRLARNHGFNDGNKRTSLAVTGMFLELNGVEFTPDVADKVVSVPIWLQIADGSLSEEHTAHWIQAHIQPLS